MTDPQSPFTLLVAVDYSDPSIVAVDEALRYAAGRKQGRVVALLVLPGTPPTMKDLQPTAQSYVERSRQTLVELLNERRSRLGLEGGVAFEGAIAFGDPAARIIDHARTTRANLLVLGTHGRKGLERLLLGSVALEVAQKAPCSVLIARAEIAAGSDVRSEHTEPTADKELPVPLAPGQVVTEPHIDSGRVVVHVLDEPSGRVFIAAFEGFGRVTIEPMEGEFTPFATPPSAEDRARAAATALAHSRQDPAPYEELFAELARRRGEL